jgi:transposase
MNNIILGIDISKLTFDLALLNDDKVKTKKFTNTSKGFSELKQWLKNNEIEIVFTLVWKRQVVMNLGWLNTFMIIILKLA